MQPMSSRLPSINYLIWQSERLHKVLDFVSTVHDLCAVLGMDFFSTVTEVHPSLNDSTGVQSKSISNDTLSRLAKTVLALKEDKKQRLRKVKFFSFPALLGWYLCGELIESSSLHFRLFLHGC